jgi:hypothetical protein
MFVRAMGKSADTDAEAVDGVNQNAWFAAYINTAFAAGLIEGSINPAQPMTRIQTAQLLAAALDVFDMRPEKTTAEVNTTLQHFTDLDGLSEAQRACLAVTVYHEIFRGHGDGRIGPSDELTRSQMASLAVRFQNLILQG